jgi:peptidoglycan hydrolase-like protein with peptidoglycan-binding domain
MVLGSKFVLPQPMRLQNFLEATHPPLRYSFEAIASDRELAQQIQVRLKSLQYLDSVADGNFGPISTLALRNFQKAAECNEPDFLGAVTAKKLIETRPEQITQPPIYLSNDLPGKILKYMQAKDYAIFQGEQYFNIIYVEGLDADGRKNADIRNQFNDRRIIIEIINGVPWILGNWEATTEPGDYYTYAPMNKGGAARIKFGQYRAWQVGTHGNAEPHRALIQVQPVTVFRDLNKDFSRIGDKTETGLFGINQHWGYDLPYNDVHNASAGCLVGRTRDGHREFMRLIKQDKRYMANNAYVFYTTVIPGDEL